MQTYGIGEVPGHWLLLMSVSPEGTQSCLVPLLYLSRGVQASESFLLGSLFRVPC